MPSGRRSAIWDKFGQANEAGFVFLICPHDRQQFDSLSSFKAHMTSDHGGFDAEDIEEASPAPSDNGASPPGQEASVSAGPKKLSRRSRDLNDKLNDAINLCIEGFLRELSQEERQRLVEERTEVLKATAGIECDFEERIFKLSGTWAILAALIFLFVAPNLKTIITAIKKKQEISDNHATE